MKAVILILLSGLYTSALADQFVTMPDGGHCYVGSSGVAWGCSGGANHSNSGGPLPLSPADRAAIEQGKTDRARMKMLQECLRTSDWPGKPGRSECQQMYGN